MVVASGPLRDEAAAARGSRQAPRPGARFHAARPAVGSYAIADSATVKGSFSAKHDTSVTPNPV